ncbi:MAG: VWA domain-containing protein [Planctomycetaceae bacterium]|nr:VWA domain-containing protein [Planctomycetales bacterium]MCB9926911.1 VWA domain-containing protein [Planctomycetaceae bacterium]
MLREWRACTSASVCLVALVGCSGASRTGDVNSTPASAQRDSVTRLSEEPLDESYRYAEPNADLSVVGKVEHVVETVEEIPVPSSNVAIRRQRQLDSQHEGRGPGAGGDKYSYIAENIFVPVREQPLSTFSIDVDTASYSKTRMHLLQQNTLPPADAVRIEEFVNYFDYDYPPPVGDEPFSVNVEVADAPWRVENRLVRIGLRGHELHQQRPSSNLVFLLDVSGSMDYHNKLPLVKEGLRMLTWQLNENDRVSIVVYAGAAGLVLPPTHGDDKHRILDALDQLHAGGSTNGGQGIQLAYQVAAQNFIKGGVNRVILCSDGDFNVGTTSTGALVRLAEQQSKAGIFLSVLGFGMGNHNDAMMEELSNKANGNYAFIDGAAEARKVLCEQINSTLVTIAKDVKIQIEFNPAHVVAYRLIGYENRHLEAHEFNDDKRDAGEIGAGHTVTALYEIVPAGEPGDAIVPTVDPLKYQTTHVDDRSVDELMTVKLRYKHPNENQSQLIVAPVKNAPVQFEQATNDFRFASVVAAFGMLLRESEHLPDASFASILEIANATRGEDRHGYRGEFIQMVTTAARLAGEPLARKSSLAPFRRTPSSPTPAVTYCVPKPVYYSSSYDSFTHAPLLMIIGIVLSVILTLSATVAMVMVSARMLVLPSESANTQPDWPCTAKQRACVSQKPPVRAFRATSSPAEVI